MKEPIEELFKQSLKGHEMPYNPDAWKAMNARLDVVSPITSPTPTSYLKYYLGAAGIGAAAIATYFFFANGNTPEKTASNSVAQETRTEQTSGVKVNTHSTASNYSDVDVSDDTQTLVSNDSDIMKTHSETATQSNSDVNTTGTTKTNSTNTSNQTIVEGPAATNTSNAGSNNLGSNNPTPTASEFNEKMTFPTIADLCLNEEVTITNPNGKEIYLLDALGSPIKTIPANKAVVFKPSIVGNYSLGYTDYTMDSRIESVSNFRVNRIPDADFTIDLVNKFENGLPSTHVEAIGGQGTYVWTAKNQTANGVESDMHFYKKGEQTIELTVNNDQCSASVEKTIYIEDDYNLLAVNSFSPASLRPENTTFMPFGLTHRSDVNFVLTIIDGRDGGIVYQTSDASLPWDGTDIRSGRRNETPQVYVWKAVITNPAANEPSEYRGTITMN